MITYRYDLLEIGIALQPRRQRLGEGTLLAPAPDRGVEKSCWAS